MQKNGRNIHYAWFVLIACCALQAGALGAISNCKGVFYDAICTDLNLSLGAFTLQGVFSGVASAAATPYALRMLKKHKMHLVLFGAGFVYAATQYLMSYLNAELWTWYAMSIIQSLAGAFVLFLPVPIILNRWFVKKRGLATAIATSFSGLSSMILNPVYASITEQYGWRVGYRSVGVISFLLMCPILLFVLRGNPEEKGTHAYGEEETQQHSTRASAGVSRLDNNGLLMMICLAVIAVCISCGSCFQSHLTKYGLTIRMSLEMSAYLPSAAMLGSVVCKPLMGVCSDRIGPKQTAALFYSINLAGFVMLLFSGASRVLLYAGSALCGVSMAANVVLFPLLMGHAMQGYDFEKYYAYLSMVISLTGVSAGAMFGYVFDLSGSYIPCFVIQVIIALINLASLAVMWIWQKRHRIRQTM